MIIWLIQGYATKNIWIIQLFWLIIVMLSINIIIDTRKHE